MGQSLAKIYIHLIYGTKNRYPFIKADNENKIHAYMTGTLNRLDSPAITINGTDDHIHILFKLSKNYSLSKIVEEVKKQSSKWIKDEFPDYRNFLWQIGYAGFSVSSSKVDVVKRYIDNQKEHHKQVSFDEEVRLFMEKYKITEFDEEYFWK